MKSQILKSPLPYLALLIAHAIWGLNYVVAKVALTEFPPMSLAFLRYFVALLLLLPFLITLEKKDQKLEGKDLPMITAAGLLMVTVNISFFYIGLSKTTAIDASVLSLTIPMLSVLGGWWFLKEKIYLINLAGIFLGLVGAITIIGLHMIISGGVNYDNIFGNILLTISNIGSVAGLIIAKDVLKKYSPILITGAFFAIGAITFLIPAILDYLKNPDWIASISILGFIGFLYITLLSSIAAAFLLLWATKKTDVIQANLFQYIEPAIAATFAVPFLGEKISYSFIIGTVLVVLGVYWGTLGKQHHHHLLHRHHRN